MFYLLALTFIFTAIFLTSLAGGMAISDQKPLAGKATAIERELAKSFAERALAPIIGQLGRLARRMSPDRLLEGTNRRLILAGHPRDLNLDKFLALKIFSGLVAASSLIPWYLWSSLSPGRAVQGAILLALTAFFLPDLWLNQKVAQRQKEIRLALPDTLDLLNISVEAGLGFDAALSRVVSATSGPLSEEFFRTLQEIRLGVSRRDAFKNLENRTDVPELNSFILAMLQADIFGVSIGKVLRVQAREMRIKRRQKAEEVAMKTPVKIVFPLVFCIFPALLVVVLGPAVIQIYEAIIKGL